jgi:hypothetical protein
VEKLQEKNYLNVPGVDLSAFMQDGAVQSEEV